MCLESFLTRYRESLGQRAGGAFEMTMKQHCWRLAVH